jgi:glycosyltransferase involved in cell wall biosynthesis
VHIAFVTPESPYGEAEVCGVAAYLRAIIPAIADVGHRVTVIANARAEKTFDAENGRVSVRHFRLPSLHWYAAKLPLVRSSAPLPLRQLEWSIAFYREAKRVAVKNKIDVIESTEIGSLFLHRIAPLVIRLHGSERIFREHSGLPLNASVRWNDRLEAIACNRAAAITAPSQLHASEIAQRRGWPTDRVQVIPNAISEKLLRAASEFHPNGNRERIVFYTGRLAPVKGVETLLAAAKLARATDPSIRFVLAGPWQMPLTPEKYGLELNRQSSDGVLWIGPQNQTDLIEWYRRATLFVMPSYFESFGISVVEAMAFGLPTVGTRAGGLSEVIDDDVTGLLVSPGNPTALAGAILQLLGDPERRRSMSRLARDHAFGNFTPDHTLKATLKVYSTIRGMNEDGLKESARGTDAASVAVRV